MLQSVCSEHGVGTLLVVLGDSGVLILASKVCYRYQELFCQEATTTTTTMRACPPLLMEMVFQKAPESTNSLHEVNTARLPVVPEEINDMFQITSDQGTGGFKIGKIAASLLDIIVDTSILSHDYDSSTECTTMYEVRHSPQRRRI